MKLLKLNVVLILLTAQLVQSFHYPQYFQAFNYNHCIGASTDFLSSQPDLRQTPAVRSAKSVSARGLWRFKFGDRNYTMDFSHAGKPCYVGIAQTDTRRLEFAIQLVPGDLDDSVLALYPSKNFEGTPHLISTADHHFDNSIVVNSWALTGTRMFTVYSGANYSGSSACIAADLEIERKGWGVTYNSLNSGLMVRSLRAGCETTALNSARESSKKKATAAVNFSGGDEVQVEFVEKILWE